MFKDYLFNDERKGELKIVKNLSASEFEEKLKSDSNAILVDVRTPMENSRLRIPNSILIDIYNPSFLTEIEKLDRSKNYYIYCRSGNRSYQAGNIMLRMGFEKVYNLKPGIIGWDGEKESSN
jgi:rhodanese-related sulfurtransferase